MGVKGVGHEVSCDVANIVFEMPECRSPNRGMPPRQNKWPNKDAWVVEETPSSSSERRTRTKRKSSTSSGKNKVQTEYTDEYVEESSWTTLPWWKH